MRSTYFLLLASAICLLPLFAHAGLNDTGIVLCGNAASNTLDCSASDPASYPRQDARFGRAAMDAAGVLYKIGASSKPGFDFTKIANNGTVLAAGAAQGGGATDWACTRDNVTGLTWETKVNDNTHLRHKDWTYSWYNSDATRNAGDAGGENNGICFNQYDAATNPTGNKCDTEGYVAAINAVALCGYTDWRMAGREELRSFAVLDSGVDTDYFPNLGTDYWAGDAATSIGSAWIVSVPLGLSADVKSKSDTYRVLLVRGTWARP